MHDEDGRGKTRHVSIRVGDDLFRRLDVLAGERGETVSHCARTLLEAGLEPGDRPRDVIDDAITALQLVRTQVSDRSTVDPPADSEPLAPRTVNILNAKTNLSRLLADVGRGEEIIIAHAGAARARLVPVIDTHPNLAGPADSA